MMQGSHYIQEMAEWVEQWFGEVAKAPEDPLSPAVVSFLLI